MKTESETEGETLACAARALMRQLNWLHIKQLLYLRDSVMAWSLSWTSTPANQVAKTRPCIVCIKKRGDR